MDKLSLSLVVGAAFASSFNTIIASAPRKLASIGTALDAVNKQGRKFDAFQGAERDLEVARGRLAASARPSGWARIETATAAFPWRSV